METPKELTITVTGTCNSGKSTIAQLVAEQLLLAGFKVHFVDEPMPGGWHANRIERLRYIAAKPTTVTIVTKQVPRKLP